MENSEYDKLLAQGRSDLPGLGERGVFVPGLLMWLPGEGLGEALKRETENASPTKQLAAGNNEVTNVVIEETRSCIESQELIKAYQDNTADYIKMLKTLIDSVN